MDQFRQVNSLFGTQVANRRDRALTLATWLAVGLAAGLSLLVAAGILLIRRSAPRECPPDRQQELRELLQVAVSEEESQLLLIHHVQRAIPGAAAAVLNRNSSDDRLECRLDPEAIPLRWAGWSPAQASLLPRRPAEPPLSPEARRGPAAAL